MKKIAILAGVSCAVAVVPAIAMAAVVNIAGSHATGSYAKSIDTSVLFDLNSGPVTATGTIDLSDLPDGVLFIGLISKVDYDYQTGLPDSFSTFFPDYRYFVDTAYASFDDSPRAGLGQYLQSGELTQSSVPGVVNPITSFEATFDDSGMSLTVQGNSTSRAYNFGADNLTFTSDGSPYTDFSQGAYAFVGTWFGDTEFDVTFTGPAAVPAPAALPLFSFGVALLGVSLGRKRRRPTAG